MPESLILPAGMIVKLDERKFMLTGNYVVAGDVVPEKEVTTQKTYNIKVICPNCNRIGRFTKKNWIPGDVRNSVVCVHVDGSTYPMELADATEEPDYAG